MTLRVPLLVASACAALVVCLILLARTSVALLRTGAPPAVALGVGVGILSVVGAWALLETLRAGLAQHRLARLAAGTGMELGITGLPRTASGRIRREAADALFETVRAELQADPDNWGRWYRLARAYDLAGDRARARKTMRRAVALLAAER